ncbi:hypothetical protein KAR91_18625 [Candidatus Pacearchaeota archaeon]|nr:hypothetical protein [Candidatus Pacearchaeota archaeon]
MAELSSSTISQELFSDTDVVLSGQAMPINTSVSSSVFEFGKTLDALELVGVAKSEITIGATFAATITVAWDTDPSGSFSNTQDVLTIAPSTITAGTELFRYVADHLKPVWYKVTITSTDTASVGTVDVNIGSVRK